MQRGPSRQQQKDNTAACLCFLKYLAFLRPAADRAVSILAWVVSRGRSCLFLLADSDIQEYEEGRFNSGLFASKRSTALSRRLMKSIELRYGTLPSLAQTLTRQFQMSKRKEHRKRKSNCSQTNRLENRRGFSHTITTIKS
jgi:hypothetical protein